MPAFLRLSQSLPAVGMKRSPDPMSIRIRSLSDRTRVTFVGELYCSPICPAALNSSSRSGEGAPGARKLVGSTRWPSLTTVTSKAPCLNENGEAAKAGRARPASAAAVAERRVRRLNFDIGGRAWRRHTAFYANSLRPATCGVSPHLPHQRFWLAGASHAIHDQVDDAQDQSQPDQALRRHAISEFGDVFGYREHEHPGALPENQVDQHDRENGDEAKLDAFPQKLLRVGHEFAHGKNLFVTHTAKVGGTAPHPDCV